MLLKFCYNLKPESHLKMQKCTVFSPHTQQPTKVTKWAWAENPTFYVIRRKGPIWIYLVGFWGLGGVPIDRKLLGDRFGRILSSGSAIFVNFQLFWEISILLPQIPRSWYAVRTVISAHLVLGLAPWAYASGPGPWAYAHGPGPWAYAHWPWKSVTTARKRNWPLCVTKPNLVRSTNTGFPPNPISWKILVRDSLITSCNYRTSLV